MPPFNTIRPDFSSRLRLQRLSEELAAAQKTIQEYEDLFATLYQNGCEHCRKTFEIITDTADSDGVAVVMTSISVVSPSSPTPRTSVEPITGPRFSPHQHGLNTPHTNGVPEPGSSRGHAVRRQPSVEPPGGKVSTSPKVNPDQWLVKYNGAAKAMEVKIEHVWIHESHVACVKFNPDGKSLAVELAEGKQETLIYDVQVGEKTCILEDRNRISQENSGPLWTNYLSFSPDGRYLAAGYSHGQTMIWEVGKKYVRNTFQINTKSNVHTVYVDFSPDGRFVLTGPQNGGVRIRSMRDGSLKVLQDDTSFRRALVLAVKYSPDGKYAAASDSRGMLRLWSVRTSKLVMKWRAHEDAIRCIAFTPDGKGLVTGSNDRSLKYWDVSQPLAGDATETVKYVGHSDIIRSVAISPDGRWLATGSDDYTVRIWNIKNSSPLCSLLGHKRKVYSVSFSSTGNYVACGGFDGRVSVWSYKLS